MPNYIKYSTTIPSGSLKKGNAALGITDEVTGPTSTTGWYSGINPQSGSYVVYEVAASGDPDIYCPQNATELLNLVKSKGATGGNTGSVAAALAWISTQNNLLAVNEIYPNIVTSGSVFYVDAGFVGSYPVTGSTWYDLSGYDNTFNLLNGPSFNPNGYITTDGVDDFLSSTNPQSVSSISGSDPFTFSALFKLTQYANQRASDSANYTSLLMKGAYSPSFGITLVYDLPSGGVFTRARTYSGVRNSSLPSTASGYGNPTQFSNTAFALNRWYQVDFTSEFSGTTYTFKTYVNGNLDVTSTSTLSTYPVAFQNDSNLTVASSPLGGNQITTPINIAKAAIYKKTLSQAEILQNYYQAPIVTDGLVLALDAGNLVSYESGSTTTYSMTGSLSGSLINGVGYNNVNGGTWVMDGADDFMRVSQLTGSNFPQATGTISFWYYVSSIGGTTDFSDKAIFDGYDTSGRNHFFIRNYYVSPDNIQVVGQLSGSGGAYCFAYSTYLPNDQWHNVVLTYTTGSNSSYQIYMDGILKNTGTLGANPSTFAPNGQYCGFGSGYLGGGAYACMQGKYSSLFIYNRALSATEVAQNYNAQRQRFGI